MNHAAKDRIATAESPVEPGYCRGAPIDWRLKMAAKMVLARLPLSNGAWNRLGLFRPSFREGTEQAAVQGPADWAARFAAEAGRRPARVVEIGPGRLTTRALGWAAAGVAETIFVDIADLGAPDVEAYLRHEAAARRLAPDLPSLAGAASREEIFRRLHVRYLTGGTASLADIGAASADLVVSEAVVEHIARRELPLWFREVARILAPGGISFHTVDFHDHLGGKLNSLRFSEAWWEGRFFSSSGFYTNRTPERALAGMAREAGLTVDTVWRLVWPEPPIAREEIHPDLPHRGVDLRVCAALMRLARPPGESPPAALADCAASARRVAANSWIWTGSRAKEASRAVDAPERLSHKPATSAGG